MVEKGAHLLLEARKLLELSTLDRLRSLQNDLWIGYPAANKILDRIWELFEHPKRFRMPNALIISPTNNGKTMLKEKFRKLHGSDLERFEKCKDPEGTPLFNMTKKPIISIQMPTSPDLKIFLSTAAEAIDKGRYYAHSTRPFLELELLHIFKGLDVKMIIIDELHNALNGSIRQQLEFLSFLRYMGNELQVPLVCFGTGDAYLAVKRDRQLENRFEPLILPLWKAGQDFNSLLESFVRLIPLEKYSELAEPKIVRFLLRKSEGVIGEVANILRVAAWQAIAIGKEIIDLELLEKINYQSATERSKLFEREVI